MSRRYCVALLAFLCIWLAPVRADQGTSGDYLRLNPTVLPLTCNTGDIRFDTSSQLVQYCTTNSWNPISPGGGVPPFPLGQVVLGTGTNVPTSNSNFYFNSTTNSVFVQGNVTASQFMGFLSGTASYASTAGFVSSASQAGTAAFAGTASFASTAAFASTASFAGTASATTAFTVTPTACGAGVWANAIGPNGNLTCAIVSTASTAGTASFASTASSAGTASTSGTASFATSSSTASTSGTAALASTASAINFIVGLTQGGTGLGSVTNHAVILGDSGSMGQVAPVGLGYIFASGGTNTDPSWLANGIQIGVNGTSGGSFVMEGATTGAVTLAVPSTISTSYTLTFPPTAGTATQVLQTNGTGGTTWVNQGAAPTVYAWAGFHATSCNWSSTSTSFGDFPLGSTAAGCALNTRSTLNFASVNSYTISGNPGPGIIFTAPVAGFYQICATVTNANSNTTTLDRFQMLDGSGQTIMAVVGVAGAISGLGSTPICGNYSAANATGSIVIKLQAASGGTANIVGTSNIGTVAAIEWSMHKIN